MGRLYDCYSNSAYRMPSDGFILRCGGWLFLVDLAVSIKTVPDCSGSVSFVNCASCFVDMCGTHLMDVFPVLIPQ